MLRPASSKAAPNPQALQAFLASVKDLHVQARVAKGEVEASEAIRAILAGTQGKSVVVAGIPPPYKGLVRSACAGVKVTFVEDLQGKPQSEALATLASADAGITWAVNGLASEGAMLEVVYDDSFKLASSLPIVHIALLEASSIIGSLGEALPMVGDIVAKAPAGRKPIVSFISGPSKTGDIEMRLLYGVHGPHTVHALILDWR